jgi:glucokinase
MPGLRSSSILEVNEFLVLDYLRANGSTTRVDVARNLGLSASSVSRIIRRLEQSGAVLEQAGSSTGGRPRSVISFNARAGVVLGIDLGGTKCHGAIADLAGTILAEDIRPTQQEGAPYPTLLAVIDLLSSKAAELGQSVTALAVGMPAYLDPDTGLATGGPNVNWQGFPLTDELAAHVSAPFVVDNDANLAALAHAWRGDARDCLNYAVIALGTGIGAGIVIDGRLARGRNNAAGEVGYMVLSPNQLSVRHSGGLGGFERAAAGPAIAEAARALLDKDDRPSALRGGPCTTEAILTAARDGDPLAASIVETVLDSVALVVIAIAAVANPEIVVLDGSVGRALSPYLQQLGLSVSPHLPAPPTILTSSLGTRATVLGAIAAAMQLSRQESQPADLGGVLDLGLLQRRRGPGVEDA